MKQPFALAVIVLTGISLGGSAAHLARHSCRVAPPPEPTVACSFQQRAAPPPARATLPPAARSPIAKAARAFADDLERMYHEGERDAADQRIASSEAREAGFNVACFDALPDGTEARATLHRAPPQRGYSYGGHEDMELTVLCSTPLARPLVVTFPPGSYGVGTEKLRGVHHGGDWRRERARAQDLAFLRASVVVVEPGDRFASSSVPIACANFSGESPMPYENFPLARFERGSAVDRLLCQICTGMPTDDRVAQLAVWVVRNDIGPGDLVRDGYPLLTFGSNVAVEVGNGHAAAELLRRSGFEVEKARFFQEMPEATSGEPMPVTEPAPAPRRPEAREMPLALATS